MTSLFAPATLAAALSTPVTHKRQLVSWLESGIKPYNRWSIGCAWETFLFNKKTCQPLAYEGETGLKAVLHELQAFRWRPLEEAGQVIGLQRGTATLMLEPAGQMRLIGSPFPTLHDSAEELGYHLDELNSVGNVLGFSVMGIGFAPTWKREEMPWIPKSRYRILREYMPKAGSLGLDMMQRTATVQASFDYGNEADMVRKMRLAVALQPVIGALFANSPFRDGRPSGELSFRNRVWQHTDPVRCAYPEFVFDEGFGFEAYVDWALSVPLCYIQRGGQALNAINQFFPDFMKGQLAAANYEEATLADWELHLDTLFSCVRLKRVIEMRGADMGTFDMALALPALWTGLLYDAEAIDQALQLIRSWTKDDRASLYKEAPRLGLETLIAGRPLRAIAKDILAIAEAGLKRRKAASSFFIDETDYLWPLHPILEYGVNYAEDYLRRYADEWQQNAMPLFTHARLR